MFFNKLIDKIKDNQSGNILIQLPIAATIIGGLTFAGTSLAGVLPQARDSRRAADAYQVTQALNLYYQDYLSFPVYQGSNANAGWELLQNKLESTYIYEFPQDPLAEQNYSYWSDGQTAKVTWYSEVEGTDKQRLAY
jgi:hypothetical protein